MGEGVNRLRLVGVTVSPSFVLDDGEHLMPVQVQPVQVSAADWPAYSTDGFTRDLALLQEQVDAQQTPSLAPPTSGSREDNHGYPDGVLPCSTVHPGQDVYHPEGHPKP